MVDINWKHKILSVLASKGKSGWSLTRFAKELSKRKGETVSRSAVSAILNAKNPTTKTVRLVSEALSVSPAYFYTGRIRTRRRNRI